MLPNMVGYVLVNKMLLRMYVKGWFKDNFANTIIVFPISMVFLFETHFFIISTYASKANSQITYSITIMSYIRFLIAF